jgi:hypothetical protein
MASARMDAGMVSAPSAAQIRRAWRRNPHPGPGAEIDTESERWHTAIHEAGHAVVAEHLGARVTVCVVIDEMTGYTGDTAESTGDVLTDAVIAVAGERATRLLLGRGGGAQRDYQHARQVLHGTGRDLAWAEHRADDAVTANRREITRTARTLYRKGRR